MIRIVRKSGGFKPQPAPVTESDFMAQVRAANQKQRQAETQAERDALLTLREDGTSKDGGFSWQAIGPASE